MGQIFAHRLRHPVMAFTQKGAVEQSAAQGEGIHCRIDALDGLDKGQNHGDVQMGKDCADRWVRHVVGRDTDRFYRCDVTAARDRMRSCNSEQARLVAHRGRHTPEQSGNLVAGL